VARSGRLNNNPRGSSKPAAGRSGSG
jgi:hypothetical protein